MIEERQVEKAVAAAGGATALAALVADGLKRQNVEYWLKTGVVPSDRCPAIERALGAKVVCEQLRPDVQWVRIPDAAWPHPCGRPLIDVVQAA